MSKFNDYNYKKLADAIIGQAVIDYCNAGDDVRGRRIKKSIEKFARSGLFTILSDMEPDYFLERIKDFGAKDITISLEIEEVR